MTIRTQIETPGHRNKRKKQLQCIGEKRQNINSCAFLNRDIKVTPLNPMASPLYTRSVSMHDRAALSSYHAAPPSETGTDSATIANGPGSTIASHERTGVETGYCETRTGILFV